MLPVPPDMVSQSLDARALALLRPPPAGPPLHISFAASEGDAGDVPLALIIFPCLRSTFNSQYLK